MKADKDTTAPDRQEIRMNAQTEAHDIASRRLPIAGFDRLSREEAANTLGKSWSNISTIYPDNSATIRELKNVLERLDRSGYTTSLDTTGEGAVTIEVSITIDVMERLE